MSVTCGGGVGDEAMTDAITMIRFPSTLIKTMLADQGPTVNQTKSQFIQCSVRMGRKLAPSGL